MCVVEKNERTSSYIDNIVPMQYDDFFLLNGKKRPNSNDFCSIYIEKYQIFESKDEKEIKSEISKYWVYIVNR